MKVWMLGAVAASALALSGCGSSGGRDEASDTQTSAPPSQNGDTSPTDAHNGNLPESTSVTDQSTLTEITPDDRQKLAQYGACATLSKLAIKLIKAQSSLDQSTASAMIENYALQAAVYTVLIAEINGKYENKFTDEIVKVVNKYNKELYLDKNSVTGNEIRKFMDDSRCLSKDFGKETMRLVQNHDEQIKELKSEYMNL